ncbi:JmjC domain, hydroxylase-domain-containing protein [Phialemonium atrogriseum]|uniref:JmjC domain, hydroxylase-domain-containing protein n=1 Tax=Phialemonium atrogriseum TaxID=1093897 RepID=A0AAJ0FE16_9PEZI|nr:JmjC domain, hydroxylase-domain-containing protein [Phialemonium atrogriseum]KAK1763827.1 JmjC domain, hydroxylase-domain-containing protein [Phialemonium atrogriseum]
MAGTWKLSGLIRCMVAKYAALREYLAEKQRHLQARSPTSALAIAKNLLDPHPGRVSGPLVGFLDGHAGGGIADMFSNVQMREQHAQNAQHIASQPDKHSLHQHGAPHSPYDASTSTRSTCDPRDTSSNLSDTTTGLSPESPSNISSNTVSSARPETIVDDTASELTNTTPDDTVGLEHEKNTSDNPPLDGHPKPTINYRWEGDQDTPYRVLLLLPTNDQYSNTPALLARARDLGAAEQGVFKIEVPAGHRPKVDADDAVTGRRTRHHYPGRKYSAHHLGNGIYHLAHETVSRAKFGPPPPAGDGEHDEQHRWTVAEADANMEACLREGDGGWEENERNENDSRKDKQKQNEKRKAKPKKTSSSSSSRPISDLGGGVYYRTDISAASAGEHAAAGLPPRSPIWPLAGNRLDDTIVQGIGGIHGAYMYEAAAPRDGAYMYEAAAPRDGDGRRPGAVFGWHIEDVGLLAFNYLHAGHKVWMCVSEAHAAAAEAEFRSVLEENPHASLFCATGLRERGVPVAFVGQATGQVVVTFPRTMHAGFSTSYTLAEAVNYADDDDDDGWVLAGYRDCSARCHSGLPIKSAWFRRRRPGEESLSMEEYEDRVGKGGRRRGRLGTSRAAEESIGGGGRGRGHNYGVRYALFIVAVEEKTMIDREMNTRDRAGRC